jgi:hypothetical protein
MLKMVRFRGLRSASQRAACSLFASPHARAPLHRINRSQPADKPAVCEVVLRPSGSVSSTTSNGVTAAVTTAAGAAEPFVHPYSKWRRIYIMMAVGGMMSILNADQNLMAPNVSDDRGHWRVAFCMATLVDGMQCAPAAARHEPQTKPSNFFNLQSQLTAAAKDFGFDDYKKDVYL